MKDISGIPRPQVVEEFIASLQKGMTGSSQGKTVEIPPVNDLSLVLLLLIFLAYFSFSKNHYRECLVQLSSAVLLREKECYQQ